MTIRVDSEIGRLRRVLLHRPGREIDWMVPSMMTELLFDDILYGKQARGEHELFTRVLESAGVEVVFAESLLADVLASPDRRIELIERLMTSAGAAPEARPELESLSAEELAAAAVAGRRNPEGYQVTETRLYNLPPVPNYFFQRDPQFVAGSRVFFSSMATAARRREPLLAEMIFRHHPALAGSDALFGIEDPPGPDFPVGGDTPTLEGGDVLVARGDTLLVGISQRSNRRGVERLAEYLRREDTPFRHLLLVDLPTQRTYMHLDTVFTIIDGDSCLAFLPVIEPGRRLSAQIFYVDLGAHELTFSHRSSLLAALQSVGIELEAVPCGAGDDVLEQAREQWTDGANAFTIAPGVIVLYRRNRRTVEELARRGWRVIEEQDVLEGRAEVLGHGRTAITVLGNELSRARGGPRCMTMPLTRDEVSL